MSSDLHDLYIPQYYPVVPEPFLEIFNNSAVYIIQGGNYVIYDSFRLIGKKLESMYSK